MGIHDRDYMRREARRPTGGTSQFAPSGSRWQLWAGLSVVGLLITAAIWPRKPRVYDPFDSELSDYHYEQYAEAWSFSGLDPVDVNEATLEDLLQIPAVDEEIARGIIDLRPFASIDDLLDVRGIGKTNLSIIRQHVYIDND